MGSMSGEIKCAICGIFSQKNCYYYCPNDFMICITNTKPLNSSIWLKCPVIGGENICFCIKCALPHFQGNTVELSCSYFDLKDEFKFSNERFTFESCQRAIHAMVFQITLLKKILADPIKTPPGSNNVKSINSEINIFSKRIIIEQTKISSLENICSCGYVNNHSLHIPILDVSNFTSSNPPSPGISNNNSSPSVGHPSPSYSPFKSSQSQVSSIGGKKYHLIQQNPHFQQTMETLW